MPAEAGLKIVTAVGACGPFGGPYVGHRKVNHGADQVVPVDLYIPGCPPHPLTILDGLLRLLDRLPRERAASAAASGGEAILKPEFRGG